MVNRQIIITSVKLLDWKYNRTVVKQQEVWPNPQHFLVHCLPKHIVRLHSGRKKWRVKPACLSRPESCSCSLPDLAEVDDDVELNVLGCRVDTLGTNCDQCVSMVYCCFTETKRLIWTGSPGRPPRLSHSSWTRTLAEVWLCSSRQASGLSKYHCNANKARDRAVLENG